MSSNANLYANIRLPQADYDQEDPWGAVPNALPQAAKLNMTDPTNQAAAASAWAKLRSKIGMPAPIPANLLPMSDERQKHYQANQNARRIGDAAAERFPGWPANEVFNEVTREGGVKPGQSSIDFFQPSDVLPSTARKAMNAGAGGVTLVNKNGGSVVYSPGWEPDFAKLYTAVHEGTHAIDGLNSTTEPDSVQLTLNNLGEEHAPHFADPRISDRTFAQDLEAQNLATKYGGYPSGMNPRNPWPLARKQYGTGTPAPAPFVSSAIQPGGPGDTE